MWIWVDEQGKYCVYAHKSRLTGEIFYIGMGGPKRVRSKLGRNEIWQKIVTTEGGHEVEIIAWHDDRSQAEKREREEILALRPAANLAIKLGAAKQDRVVKRIGPNPGTWGGLRAGSGRRKSNGPRCKCGKHTLIRAQKQRLLCGK